MSTVLNSSVISLSSIGSIRCSCIGLRRPTLRKKYSSMYAFSSSDLVLFDCPDGTQTFRPIVSSHHYLVRRFAPNSNLGKTFRPRPIHRKDVSPPFHILERLFAPYPYFRKTFRTQTIFLKEVSHPSHISERRFAP